MSKIIAVGDIHGCFHTLETLIEELQVDFDRDTLVFVGDYIDRGLYSKEVVKRLRDLQECMTSKRCVCLRGNHEQMAIEAASSMDSNSVLWEGNGGYTTIWSYRDDTDTMASDICWMMKLPFVAEVSNFIFSHAGLSYPLLADCTMFDLLWDRSWLRSNNLLRREKPVIFGHTPFKEGIKHLSNGDIGIDGGCVGNGSLCAIAINDDGSMREYKVACDPRDIDPENLRDVMLWYNDN